MTDHNALIINNINNIIKKENGLELIKNNEFFKDLSDIMSDDKFKTFFNKYFKTMDEIKTTVIYMKLYDALREKYKTLSGEELSKCLNVYLIHHAMTDNKLRNKVIDSTLKHLENNKLPILE
jgi:hypothetical protein